MAIGETTASPTVEIPSLGQWTIGRILEWSGSCGRFLNWEREHLILREPSAQDLAEHKQALRWLLQITRLYHAAVSDPEFPDRSAVKELHGRLLQLESSWRMFHEAMPEAEADKLLAEVFPDER
jgi:PAS domain-containing protein